MNPQMPNGAPPDWAAQQRPESGERFRGSSEVPLSQRGVDQAHDVALRLAARGGLDELRASSMGRTVHTARIISHYTHAPLVDITDGLHPWHLGYLEGQPVTPEHLALQQHLQTDNPDEALPGRGPMSVADGESFNDFKDRTLAYLKQVIAKSAADPRRAIGLVTHYRVKKLVDAWMRAGMDPDGKIDSAEMIRHDASNTPAGVDHLIVDPYTGPQMAGVDLNNTSQRLGGGIYLIRHGSTFWNAADGS